MRSAWLSCGGSTSECECVQPTLRAARTAGACRWTDHELMISLTPLESDILGDMARDSHNVREIIAFVRSANPLRTDDEVFRATLEPDDSE